MDRLPAHVRSDKAKREWLLIEMSRQFRRAAGRLGDFYRANKSRNANYLLLMVDAGRRLGSFFDVKAISKLLADERANQRTLKFVS